MAREERCKWVYQEFKGHRRRTEPLWSLNAVVSYMYSSKGLRDIPSPVSPGAI